MANKQPRTAPSGYERPPSITPKSDASDHRRQPDPNPRTHLTSSSLSSHRPIAHGQQITKGPAIRPKAGTAAASRPLSITMR
ncbi:hypothetical protein ACLOJK_037472, partial [Asimina triloba]